MSVSLFKRFAVIFVATLFAVATVVANTNTASGEYTPATGGIFNDPNGTTKQKYKIVNHINTAIDNTPSGATIRIVTFRFTLDSTFSAIQRAHDRGVNIRLLIGGVPVADGYNQQLAKMLGTDTSQPSFMTQCQHGCNSDEENSFMHSKFLTFSQTGSAQNVVMVMSANLTKRQATVGSNDLYSANENPDLYNAFGDYFEDLVTDTPYTGPMQTVATPKHELVTFPATPNSVSGDKDPYIKMLNAVQCGVKPAAGYGQNGRTVIQVAMFAWTRDRADIARKLNALSKKGCIVKVYANAQDTNATVVQRLLEDGSKVQLRNSAKDKNHDGKYDDNDSYSHTKFFLINGAYDGSRKAKLVLTGSSNLSKSAQYKNDNLLLYIHRDYAHNDYSQWFNDQFQKAPKITTN